MEWSEILQLHSWTPLAEVEGHVEPIVDGLFRVGPDAYLLTRGYNKSLEKDDPRAPFVTKAYWATSIDAARRVISLDPAFGGRAPLTLPPQELLIEATGKYGLLYRQARAIGGNYCEQGFYSREGKFLYKSITSNRMEYCFLGNQVNDSEQPFLIGLSLV